MTKVSRGTRPLGDVSGWDWILPPVEAKLDNQIGSSGRLEENLRRETGKVLSLYKKCKGGRNRRELDKRYAEFSILSKELESISKLRDEYEDVNLELQEWKNKCTDLELQKKTLLEELKQVQQTNCEEIEVLEALNEELKAYALALEEGDEKLCCSSKKISENFTREYRQVENKSCVHIQKHLIYLTYLNYNTEEENHRLEQVLFLLDKFCVSDECYHELSFLTNDILRSYLIKQKRDKLNSLCHIERVPGPDPGAQRSFSLLLKEVISKYLDSHPSFDFTKNPLKVKISGDGAKMSRTTNFMILSFSLLQSGEYNASKGNHTIGIVNGPEQYETLKVSYNSLIKDINEHVKAKKVTLGDKEIPLEFFLGGDLKFLLLSMGLSGATSDYACLWCIVHKSQRWNMKHESTYYNSDTMKRTIKSLKEWCTKKKENYCCINPPLFEIELDHVILDELHMMLRITDRLTENLIIEVMEKDSKEDMHKPRGECKGIGLDKLIKAINDIGITFNVWEKLNADGKSSKQKDWTSLVGSDKKKLMKFLPEKLKSMNILFDETKSEVIKLWEDFHSLYLLICCANADETTPDSIHQKAKAWIELFSKLGAKRVGYGNARVTPYMHAVPYHIPQFILSHGPIIQFSGQGVEKNNDDAKRIYYQKSNKWDVAKDILLLESRQKSLEHHEREKRKYVKRNEEWWNSKILDSRKRRRNTESNYTATTSNTLDE
ncbi:uncharacterized protein LOC125570187 [Nematostella vectensis]|uniref:uncharacterized protein LOC125570187 n=1 Tax=Nematostella vectensis TaxID=45351 RepID=UPI00207778DE|nr:uncharacterized protein LOC125570187 [Nematostella vectensis]